MFGAFSPWSMFYGGSRSFLPILLLYFEYYYSGVQSGCEKFHRHHQRNLQAEPAACTAHSHRCVSTCVYCIHLPNTMNDTHIFHLIYFFLLQVLLSIHLLK